MLFESSNNSGVTNPPYFYLFLLISLVILNVTFVFFVSEIISGLNTIRVSQQNDISSLNFQYENLMKAYDELLFDKNQQELCLKGKIFNRNVFITLYVIGAIARGLFLCF